MLQRILTFFERYSFGVCTYLGEKFNVSIGKIRLFFIYSSFLAVGFQLIFYIFAGIVIDIRKFVYRVHTRVTDLRLISEVGISISELVLLIISQIFYGQNLLLIKWLKSETCFNRPHFLSKRITLTSAHYTVCKGLFNIRKVLLITVLTGIVNSAFGQVGAPADSLKADSLRIKKGLEAKRADNFNQQYDVGDLYRNIFHPGKKPDTLKKRSGITIIPNVASNPTIGSQIGIKAVAGMKLGADPSTLLSVASTSASISTKGIVYFYVNHNAFTKANKWNFQGSLVAAKTVSPDFGLGIGRGNYDSEANHILSDPERKGHV